MCDEFFLICDMANQYVEWVEMFDKYFLLKFYRQEKKTIII